jgi:RHS repeat-associated protein
VSFWRDLTTTTSDELADEAAIDGRGRIARDIKDIDEAYTYDGLDRLASFQRGTITSGTMGSVNFSQDWNTLDSLGNWQTFTEDTNGSTAGGSTAYNRTHNKVNETTDSGSTWIDPVYDAAGNMTSGPKGGAETTRLHFTYDAWNRLVVVKNDSGGSPGTTAATYSYDGMNRRIKKVVGANTDDFYLSEQDQVVESRRNGDTDPRELYIWDVRYVDSAVAVYRDWDVNGAINDKFYFLTDANYNVTALVDKFGTMRERYEYMPYGKQVVLNPDFSLDPDGSDYGTSLGHQGLWHDVETGMVYNRARYLHLTLGRFMQRDPADYADGYNLYQYVRSTPINLNDPSGMISPGAPTYLYCNGRMYNRYTQLCCGGNIYPINGRNCCTGGRLGHLEPFWMRAGYTSRFACWNDLMGSPGWAATGFGIAGGCMSRFLSGMTSVVTAPIALFALDQCDGTDCVFP